VEDFRHTPVIPVSERDLAMYKKQVDEANRKGYYVEIKKDTLYFYGKPCSLRHTVNPLPQPLPSCP